MKTAEQFLKSLAGHDAAQVAGLMLAMGKMDAPKEACGFVVRDRRGKRKLVRVHHSENRASKPEAFFRITDYAEIEENYHVLAIWHSHVNARPEPSGADRTLAEKCGLPVLIVSVPGGGMGLYEPEGWRAPLLNREFVHGVHDCWSVIRDALRWPDMREWAGADREFRLELPDFERPDDWWHPLRRFPDGREERSDDPAGEIIGPPLNVYLQNVDEAGFVKMPEGTPAQLWDVILIQVRSENPNHGALYVGDGMMLHHLQDRRSELRPYLADRGAYARHTYGIYRHRSLCRP